MERRQLAIAIRQQQKIKTPVAIIAATAIYCRVPLIGNDKAFSKIEGLVPLTY